MFITGLGKDRGLDCVFRMVYKNYLYTYIHIYMYDLIVIVSNLYDRGHNTVAYVNRERLLS